MALSCIISEIKRYIGRKLRFFTPLHSTPPLGRGRGPRRNIAITFGKKICNMKPGKNWWQSWIQHGRLFESRQSRPCGFGPVHTGNKVDREKLSNSRCCRFVAKTGNKLSVYGSNRLYYRFLAGFGNSRLSTKSTVLISTLSLVCTGLKHLINLIICSVLDHSSRQTFN